MQFVITAHDYTDENALERRLAVREAHIQTIDGYKAKGHLLLGAALLNDNGDMAGSVLVADFPDRAALDDWLKNEPYVIGRVWEKIDVRPCKVGPSFLT